MGWQRDRGISLEKELGERTDLVSVVTRMMADPSQST